MVGAVMCLLLFQLAGELLVWWFQLPFPGPVVGMILLLAMFVIRGGVPDNVRATGSTLLQHLMLVLVPATTGLMLYLRRAAEQWLPIVLAVIIGAAVTMVVTAVTFRLLLSRQSSTR